MIIFLYGGDTYRSRQKLKEIIGSYKKVRKSGLNLKIFDFKKADFQDFKNTIQSSSMFNEKKLIILKNAFLNVDFQEKFLENKKKYLTTEDVMVFYSEEKSLKGKLFNFLKKNVKVQEFKPLTGGHLKNWIVKEFGDYKARPGVVNKLIEFVGDDLWQMSNEINKLVNFKKENIKEEDVSLLVKPKIDNDIFKTIDAVAQKNRGQALKLIHKHLEKGDSPLYLLSMIAFQFRNLLVIKAGYEHASIPAISKKTGIHPYVVRKTLWQAKEFSLDELKKIYLKIFQADLDIKTGRADSQMALDLFIAGIN